MAAPEVRALRGAAALPDEFFRLLADCVPQMVWSARPDGHNDYHNRRFLDYSGMTQAEISGWGWEKLIHAEDRERCHARWQRALETGEPFRMEYRLRRHDGVFLWHLGSAYPVREGKKIVRWFGACTDIEARKRAERLLEEAHRSLESEVAARTEALRASEGRLREMIQNEPECVKLLDAEGRLLEMNSAGLRMIEADDIAPLVGNSVYGIIAPSHRAAFRELTERVCQGGRGMLEFEIVGLKGTRRWLQTHAAPFRDARGQTLLLGITRDITEQRRAERALAESEQRFRSFMDNLPAVAWIKDSRFRYTWVSRQYEKRHALSADEVLGRDDFEIWPAPVAEIFRRVDRQALEENGPVQTTDQVPFADGREGRWLVIKFPLPDASGGMGVGGVRVDITERAGLERALAESEQRFRSFMDSMPVVAWTKDARFRYTWVNKGYQLRRRRSLAQVLGKDDFEIRHESIARIMRAGDEEALRRNGSVQSVLQDKGEDGAPTQWLVVRFPLPDASGTLGVAGIALDITERAELEHALRENEKRVVEATETVRQLMNRLVHAQEAERRKLAEDLHDLIGQKLTALGINLEFVRQRMPQAGAAALAGRLHQMATLLEETIVSIREVMTDLRPQALDEHGLSAALYQYGAAFEARTGLRVQVTGAEKRLPLPRDVAIALFRIAQEALTNSAKHSGASRVLVRVRKNPEGVELEVEDDGRGLDLAQESVSGGNGGWGLRMMRERAEAVGGRLSVRSANPGTRLSVVVSLDRADQRHPD